MEPHNAYTFINIVPILRQVHSIVMIILSPLSDHSYLQLQAMGNILKKGWGTTVNDLKDGAVDGDITMEDLKAVATQFAKSTDSNGDATVGAVFLKCLSSSYLSTVKCTCTKKPFLVFCRKVADALFEYGKFLGPTQMEALRLMVGKVASALSESAVNPTVKKVFKEVAGRATATGGNGAINGVVKGTAGAVAEEIAENSLSRVAQASSSAKSALKWGFVVEGACWAYTVYESKKKLNNKEITPKQHRKTVITRTGGATGSLGGGALGSFVGTLIFPGVGSFIGGFVGGVAGDYLGSWVGDQVDEAL